MKKKIFITGASSFLGEGLINKLKNTYDITVLKHNKPLKTSEEIRVVQGGIENAPAWQAELPLVDIIIHIASISHTKDPKNYEKINTRGTEKLVKIAEEKNVKQFIYISTRTIGEKCGAYGTSKGKAEEYIKKSKLPYTIIRVGEVYDESFTRAEGLGKIASLVEKSFVVPYVVDKNSTVSPIHINDVQAGILATIDNELSYNKTYTLTGPENLSLRQVIERICKFKKKSPILFPVPRIFVQIVYYVITKINKKAVLDGLERLLWIRKESLSANVMNDLHIHPRYFLKSFPWN
ncbi:MAG: NAD(P)H-binding protein [Candidatus Zambryskibacteria bacterium]|nr:NAD(P)H-binding protein [Candidatus Zambryskibacteria bacterium]